MRKNMIKIFKNGEQRYINLDEVTQIIWSKKSNKIIFNFKAIVNTKNTTLNQFVPSFHYLLTKDDIEANQDFNAILKDIQSKNNNFFFLDDSKHYRIINFNNVNSISLENTQIIINFSTSFTYSSSKELQEHSIKLSMISNATREKLMKFLEKRV